MKFILSFLLINISTLVYSQVPGCTDFAALNYNQQASVNDGSCLYANATVAVNWSKPLPGEMESTSGLLVFEDSLLTHGDMEDNSLYLFHPNSPEDFSVYSIENMVVDDWEEITEDAYYFYNGDFGNNEYGNRQNLRIYKFKKEDLRNSPTPDTIYFNYELQTDFSYQAAHSTDFDCEAFIVRNNKIYLFTKEWISEQTSIYELDTTIGQQTAIYKGSLNVNGLITGSVHFPDKQLIVLSGYSKLLKPFVYLLYDFQEDDFFGGNKRKIELDIPYCQIEAIASEDGLIYYLTNENFGTFHQKLHQVDLSPYLNHYLYPSTLSLNDFKNGSGIKIYPNPTTGVLQFSFFNGVESLTVEMYDALGRLLFVKEVNNGEHLSLNEYANITTGYYSLRCWNEKVNYVEKIVVQ